MASYEELNARVAQPAKAIGRVIRATHDVIVGQQELIDRLMVALLCNGHVLIEGLPGLAKTLTVRTLSAALNVHFQRIQFTPDLLPADLIGTQIYNPQTGEFTPRPGPIFTNIVLADEVNRAPAKVQSALLEAMEERQVTLGDVTHQLQDPFMVLATQNPIEQEGTYPLPEAQLDRFMFKVVVDYPSRDEERLIVDRMAGDPPAFPDSVIGAEGIQQLRRIAQAIYVDDRIKEYVLDLVFATREPGEFGMRGLGRMIDVGASPRATIFLIRAARAYALLQGRGYVMPDDVKAIAVDTLRHRLVLSFEAEAEDIRADQIINQILNRVEMR